MNAGRTGREDEFSDGAHVGNYRIVRIVGEGGFGRIYLAEQTEPVIRKVALKVLKSGMDSPGNLERFEIEHQTLAMMNHPSIAVVYEAGRSPGGSSFIVMEWVDGQSITQYCASHAQQGLRGRLELFIEVCQAIHHAHQRGIIHRDIKPANVLVAEQDGRPSPKIIDFGIAKLGDLPSPTLNGSGQPLGTPEYMSPEQIAGSGMGVDTRSDVYSLGAILFELLTGSALHRRRDSSCTGDHRIERPSTRVVAQESTRKGGRSEQTGFTTSSKRLIGDLDWIVMKALEQDPARRYESAAAFAADIERHLSHEPVSASPPTRIYLTKKFLYRHRRGVAAAALSVIALVAGSWFSTAMAISAREARAIESEKEKSFRIEHDLRQSRQREAERMAGVMIDTLEEDLWSSGRFGLIESVIEKAARHFEVQSDSASEPSRRLDVSIVWAAAARLHLSRGRVRQASHDIQRAIEIRDALVKENSGDPAYSIALANAYTQSGELALVRGDLAEAQQSFSQGLDMCERLVAPSKNVDRSWQLARATILCGQAELLRKEGELELARSTISEALGQLEPLAPGASSDAEIRARAHLIQAALQNDLSDPQSADETLGAARDELTPWLAANPQRATARHLASRLQFAFAKTRMSQADWAEDIEPARLALDSAIDGLDGLLRGDPDNVRWRYDRFQAQRLMGQCFQSTGFLTKARDSYGQALNELQGLRDSTEDLPSWQYDMASTHYDLSGAELEQELFDRAADSAREALAGFAGAGPGTELRWRVAEALTHERLGEIESARSVGSASSTHYAAARYIYLALQSAGSDHRPAVARLLVKISEQDQRARRLESAEKAAHDALDIYRELSLEMPDEMAYQAGLANANRQLAASLELESEPEKEKALKHLRKAWDIVTVLGGERSNDRAVKELSDVVWRRLKQLGEEKDRALPDPLPKVATEEATEPMNPEFLRIERDVRTAQKAANQGRSKEAYASLLASQSELDDLIAAEPELAPTDRTELEATILSVQGMALNGLRKPSAAAKLQEKGIALRRRLLVDKGSRHRLASDLISLAVTYQSLRRFGQSEAVLDEAVAVAQGLLEEIHPQRPPGVIGTLADSHSFLAKVMENTKKLEAAEEHAVRALELRDEIWSGRQGYATWISYVAKSHAGLGRLLGAKDADASRYREAEHHYLRAIEFQSVLAEKRPKNDPYYKHYQAELAKIYNSLGLLYRRLRSLDKALTFFDQALAIRVELPQVPLNRQSISVIHNNIALTLAEAARPMEAEEHYLTALGIRRELAEDNPKYKQFTEDLANLEDNLGGFYLQQGHHEKAEPLLIAALENWTSIDQTFKSARVRYLIGEIHRDREEWKEAESRSVRAVEDIEEYLLVAGTSTASERRTFGLVQLQLGEILLSQKQLDDALGYLRKAQRHQKALVAEGHSIVSEDLARTKKAIERVQEARPVESKPEE